MVLAAVAGCSSGPPRVAQAKIDPAAAAKAALEMYDTDKDGSLSAQELAKCPALAKSMARFDTNKDGRLTADEIAARIRTWQEQRVGLMRFSCRVLRNRAPLAGAVVRFVPEPFLGTELKPASGTTDATGMAFLSVDAKSLPDDMKGLTGIQPGLYKVEITHPKITLPAKFNTETTLGQEVSLGGEDLANVVFDVSG
jgi:hypothetical protein